MKEKAVYAIPARFRKIENLHILLWLIKDMCWALNFHWMAIFMIIPTIGVALLITYQTKNMRSELFHNLAILFWITANCTWMIGEFYGWDENLYGKLGLRQFAVVPFAIGLSIIGYYYLSGLWRNKNEMIYVQSEEGGESNAAIHNIQQEVNKAAASK
ncbi:MAG: hypothetical protein K2X48_02200 [Chitinophagaceae bacterium]|nr:hypothetical protein [Chitinophagaceae bacterium]